MKRFGLRKNPVDPPHQAVDSVTPSHLGDRRLIRLTVPAEATVTETVRPGCEQLPTSRWAHLLFIEPVQDVNTLHLVRANSAADLYDHEPLIVGGEVGLATGRFVGHPTKLSNDHPFGSERDSDPQTRRRTRRGGNRVLRISASRSRGGELAGALFSLSATKGWEQTDF